MQLLLPMQMPAHTQVRLSILNCCMWHLPGQHMLYTYVVLGKCLLCCGITGTKPKAKIVLQSRNQKLVHACLSVFFDNVMMMRKVTSN